MDEELDQVHKTDEEKPYIGEIKNIPNTGKIVVIIGYHRMETDWGKIIETEFKQHVKDDGRKVIFYEVKDERRQDTGEGSPFADEEIGGYLGSIDKVEAVIDIHHHPGSYVTKVLNSWSLATNKLEVAEDAKRNLGDLRTLPYDNYSRSRTGGRNVPYALTDAELPVNGILEYQKGEITPQMKEAIDSNLGFMVTIANAQLESYDK